VRAVVALVMFAWAACAQEPPKPPAKPEPPVVRLVQPIGVEAGKSVRLKIRGQHFDGTNAVTVRGWEGVGPLVALVQSEARAVTGYDATRIGDRLIEVELVVPASAPVGTNAAIVVSGARGESAPFPLPVLPAGSVTGEKEPNDGFRTAPGAPLPIRVRGAMEAKGDVDVFRVSLKAGTRLRAEVFAARFQSTLDAILTVYDGRFAVVSAVDDSVGRDPMLEVAVEEGGEYFVAVGYANDLAASTHEYVLVMETR
jgi:hypothetical protein